MSKELKIIENIIFNIIFILSSRFLSYNVIETIAKALLIGDLEFIEKLTTTIKKLLVEIENWFEMYDSVR